MHPLKYYLLILIALSAYPIFCQNEANNWYFGANAGLNFNDGLVNIHNDGAMDTPAGCSSISDFNGNLLFYTNGQTVWNKNHEIMQNGTNLPSDISNTQTSIIVPKPNDQNTFYIFSTRTVPSTTPLLTPGFFFSEVKFTPQNPLGSITIKGIRILDNSSERVSAVYDAATNSVKVVTFASEKAGEPKDTFFVFNVTENGLDRTPVKSKQIELVSSGGAMKISPNGEKIAIADYGGNYIYLYDFNASNSTISYNSTINPNTPFARLNPYGLEFSQDSNILYFTASSALFKFDLNNQDPVYEKEFLSSHIGYGDLQLATNGKIYVATSTNKLSVINKPEDTLGNSGFEDFSVALNPNASLSGLPNFVTSILRNRIITENKCFIEPFEFTTDTYAPLDGIVWDFGDGTTSTDFEPTHQYTASGRYMVKATIYFNNQTNEMFKEVEAYTLPEILPNEILTECDTDNDGIILINLNNIEDKVINYQRDFEFSFYHSYNDAANGLNEIEHPENYSTSFDANNTEEIFVKIVTSKGCFTISNFFIEAIYNELINIQPMYVCEFSDFRLNNEEGRFDFGQKAEEIKSQFNFPQSSNISFYTSSLEAQTKTNPLWITHESKSTRIWVRAETENNDCAGIGSFDIFVNSNIELNIDDVYTICAQQPYISLNGNASNDYWEWLDANGTIISKNQTIELFQPGNYSVTVYKTENGLVCSLTKEFTILEPKSVAFDEVISGDNQIHVSVIGNSNYEFSIDGINYYGNGKSYVFNNVSAGIYTVYVKDVYDCEMPISTKTHFIGFPKFFSPNGDGYNDTWKIEGISEDFYLSAYIYIFDRYGKTLYYMDLTSNQEGWDGYYNGQRLESNDYWFQATITDIDNNTFVKKGHFTLKL